MFIFKKWEVNANEEVMVMVCVDVLALTFSLAP